MPTLEEVFVLYSVDREIFVSTGTCEMFPSDVKPTFKNNQENNCI